jgi:hypothetical protein
MASMTPAAPVFSTGGGGFEYEDHVAAFVLAAMLAGQPPLGEEIGLVRRIDWQTAQSRWAFDDLLLTCDGPEGRRVAVSCKAGAYVTSGGWPADAVEQLWQQWTSPPTNQFRRGVDRLAVVTGALAQGVDQAWDRLLQEALATDPARFIERFTSAGTSRDAGRALVASMTCPGSLLSRISDEPVERAQLLRHVRLWHKDLQRLDSTDTSQAVEWCRQSLADGSRTTALALHDVLRSLAADRRIRGGTLEIRDLVRELAAKFEFKSWPNHDAGWCTLDARSSERADGIGDTIGETLCLTRVEVMDALVAASTPGQVVLLEGESGSGKSALVKRLAGGFTRTLWVDASDLEAPTLLDVGTALGLVAPLSELVGEDRVPSGVLIIDGAERLTAAGRRNGAQLIAAAVQAGRPWAVVVTTLEEGSDRIAAELGRALPSGASLRSVFVALPDEPTIRSLAGVLPIRLAGDASLSVVRALRNLKALDWTVRSSARKDLRRYPDLISQVWEGFIGDVDGAARAHVLKALGRVDADVVVGGVPRSMLSGVEEQRVAQTLVRDGLLTLRNERLFFRHDLLGDWARLLLLVEAGEGVDRLLADVAPNIRWSSAVRLFGEWLAQSGEQGRRILGRLLVVHGAPVAGTSITLVEGLLRSPDGGKALQEFLPDILKAAPGVLAETLKTFLTVATRPSEFSRVLRRDHPVGAAARATYRVPVPELWPGVIGALEPNAAALAAVSPVEVADVARVWLSDQGVVTKPEFASTTATCSRLAVTAAREVQARIAERGWGREEGHPRVCEALLLAAPWLPEEVAEVSLELAERRPDPPAVVARVEAVKKRNAEEMARRLAQLTDEQKREMSARRGSFSIGPTPKPRRKPFTAGPTRRVDEAFRDAVLTSGAVVRLALHKPAVAQEVLLACCLEDPGQEDPLYSDFPHNDRAGTVDKMDWYPPLYLRGPWLPLLLQSPAEGLTAVLRLVEIATEEWLRLCLPPVGAKGHEKAQQWTTITLDVDGQPRAFRGGPEVFGWYRGFGHAGNVVPSALMALEQWLYRRVDAKESVDEAVGQILQTGSSVAFLGVLAALARKEPELLRGCLRPLMTSWMLLSWDDQLTIQATMPDFDPFNLKALNGWIEDEAERWGKLPHRSVRLQWLVATGLALGDQALIEECGRSRTGWQAEIDGGGCLDAEEAQRLVALLDPANLSARAVGEGRMEVQVNWPKHLAAKYEERGKRSEPGIIAFRLCGMMRKALDAGTLLQHEQAEAIWKIASELGDLGALDGKEDANSPIVARVAAAAALEALAPAWLDQFPARRAWCEDAVMKAVAGAPREPSFASGLSMHKEHVEAFTGEWALARLAAGDGRAEVRRILAEAMTAIEHIVTGQVLASAVRQAANLTDDFGRLFNLLWLWAVLRNLPPDWPDDQTKGQKIAEGRRSKLIRAFVDRRIPNTQIPWDDLRLRAARARERYYRAERERDPIWSAIRESGEGDPTRRPQPLPAAWGDYEHHGFDWSVLERVIEPLPFVVRPSIRPELGPLAEFDRRLFDLVEFTLRHAPTDELGEDNNPNQFDALALSRISSIVADHEDETVSAELWQRLAPLLVQRHRWCETFFGSWFRQSRDGERAERFHRRWQAMIASVSTSPDWGAESAARSYDLNRAWSALLGIHGRGPGLGLEADRPYLGALVEVYRRWAQRCLSDRSRLQSFCVFLQKPGAVGIRLPALGWVDAALENLATYLPTEADLVSEVVGYCIIVWYQHLEEILVSPAPRTSLVSIVQRLSRLRVLAIEELKADLELTISMSERSGSAP